MKIDVFWMSYRHPPMSLVAAAVLSIVTLGCVRSLGGVHRDGRAAAKTLLHDSSRRSIASTCPRTFMTYPWNRFSDLARQAIGWSQAIAIRRRAGSITPRFLRLGITCALNKMPIRHLGDKRIKFNHGCRYVLLLVARRDPRTRRGYIAISDLRRAIRDATR